jgi:hypothetical protein
MAVTIYGDGSKYGDADAVYGRAGSELAAAQIAKTRETALKIRVIDERINRWVEFTGSDQNARNYSADGTKQYNQDHWSYRAQADICELTNGNIIRVRIDVDDRQVYVQTITDPTIASQWTTWGLLYSGTHYAVAIAPDTASTYVVYSVKSDGLYKNNSLVWSQTGLVKIRCHRDTDGRQLKDALWLTKTAQGVTISGDIERKLSVFFTENVASVTPYEVEWNWIWQRHGAASIKRDDGKFVKITSYSLYAPTNISDSGESLLSTVHPAITQLYIFQGPRLIRALPGQFGHNTLSDASIFKLDDGYFYIFYIEVRTDSDFEFTSSLETPLVWQRSRDGEVWSEPVHTGFNTWGFAGLVESGSYVYLVGNGKVYRRPNTSVEYDISNYVPSISWESPKDNQTGTGQLSISNLNGINDALRDLSDRRIIVEPGIKVIDGTYQYARLDDFWINRMERTLDGKVNRLTCDFGNIWSRLENPLRDIYNFVGKTVYEDWKSGKINEPFNYFFASGQGSKVEDGLSVEEGGIVLWTGWKGYNPFFHVDISSTFEIPSINVLAGLKDAVLKASDSLPLAPNGKIFKKERAVDGDPLTRWSPPEPQGPPTGHWWAADISIQKNVSAFRYYIEHAEDRASSASIYGSNSASAWSWLVDGSGKLINNPLSNGWTLVSGWANLNTPDTGKVGFAAASYRYWLVKATGGTNSTVSEFDISEFELWAPATTGQAAYDIIFRYVDATNYMKLNFDGSNLRLYEVVNDVTTQIGATQSGLSNVTSIGIKCRWRAFDLYTNQTYLATIAASSYAVPTIASPGYVGFNAASDYTVGNFIFEDLEYDYTSKDLIRQALALGDYHDSIVGQATARQYAIIWGPQSDLPTGADGLRQLLEGEKLDLVWRDGFIEVGQFKDATSIRTLQNEIISANETNEANRRINLAVVDGNENTWMEIDAVDVLTRDRMIQSYLDLPELLAEDDVKNRAREEIRRSKLGSSPGGTIPLQFDLWRMDPITWIDPTGTSKNVRIEGISVEINQGESPYQRETLDMSLL